MNNCKELVMEESPLISDENQNDSVDGKNTCDEQANEEEIFEQSEEIEEIPLKSSEENFEETVITITTIVNEEDHRKSMGDFHYDNSKLKDSNVENKLKETGENSDRKINLTEQISLEQFYGIMNMVNDSIATVQKTLIAIAERLDSTEEDITVRKKLFQNIYEIAEEQTKEYVRLTKLNQKTESALGNHQLRLASWQFLIEEFKSDAKKYNVENTATTSQSN